MPRAVIVAAGDLDSLPGEMQVVANTLSAAGWTVRLCLGPDASRAVLMAASGEATGLKWAAPTRYITLGRYGTVTAV